MSQSRDTARVGFIGVLSLLALVSSATLAQPAMVTDINATLDGTFGLEPQAIVASGSTVFLSGTAEGMGVELWKSDGTSGGTVLVRDIWPGGGSSNPSGFVVMGGIAYFSADDGVNGAELWRSDGTAGGTWIVKDVCAGSGASSPAYLTVIGSTLYFRAFALDSGQELWKSDGTPAGTVLVSDICPGESCGSSPWNLTAVGTTLFFSAWEGTSGNELWKSDGTAGGTVLVKDIWPGGGSSNPSQLKAVGATLFFAAAGDGTTGNELWKSDGTSGGTVLVRDICPTAGCNGNPTQLAAVGGTLFFAANDGSNGTELWKSDGTSGGTSEVKDLWSGTNSSAPSRLTPVGSTLFFRASDGTNGNELWKSDGTSGGTALVKDLCAGGCGSNPSNLVAVGTTLYFSAYADTWGDELFRSDGTSAGTSIVKDICPGGCGPGASLLTNANGTLFFRLYWPGGELWKSDGTDPGTVAVREFDSPSSFPSSFVELGGSLFFVASDGTSNRELWKSDGTPGGTSMVLQIGPAAEAGVPGGLVKTGSTLYFAGYDGTSGNELWKSDGTPGGTSMVTDICPGGCWSGPSRLTAVGSDLYFVANDGTTGNELWKSDGTPAGTVQVDICPGSCSASLSNLVAVGSTLFFTASTSTNGYELWKSDGTDPGTDMVADICPGTCSSNPAALTAVGGTLFFRASNGGDGWELWRSDGTPGGTVMVRDIRSGGASGWPDFLTNVNGTLFFTAWNPDRELWKSDGTSNGTVLVKDICPGPCYSTPAGLLAVGGRLFFRAHDGTGGMELWTSDGTPDFTYRVADIASGSASSIPRPVAAVGSTFFFAANDGTTGEELWKSDGTPAGTFRVLDANPGAGHGSPWEALVAGANLFFNVNDGTHGQELWKLGTADLAVGLTDSPDPVAQGATLTYVATVTNQGTGAASGVWLTVALSDGVTFTSSTPGSPTCVHASGIVSCGLGTVSAGASPTVTVRVTPKLGTVGTVMAFAFATANEADTDGNDDFAMATTTVPGPPPPANLQAQPLSSSSIRLTWTDSASDETGFRVERSANGTSFSPIEILPANTATYPDPGLSSGTLYYYRVVTLRSGSESRPSNVAAATTFAGAAATICPTALGSFHGNATGSSLAWNGTGWAAAWSDVRDDQRSEIWFQRLASATGAPQGSPVRVTTSGTGTGNHTLRWNGSAYGLLFREGITALDVGPSSALRFALLDADGNKIRGDVVIPHDHVSFRAGAGQEAPLLWNGSGWGVFVATETEPPSDIWFMALDADGDLAGSPISIAATPAYELSPSAAWNGSEYGVVWASIPQDGLSAQVLFQRVGGAGAPIGSPQVVAEWTSPTAPWWVANTAITWESGSWVVGWLDGFAGPGDAEAIYLRRYGTDGLPAGAAVRLSLDLDPDFPPEEQVPIYDETPVLFPRAGGGVVVFTACWPNETGWYETCRYEADSSLARVGTRTMLTAKDSTQSARSRAATDGSRFLLSWPENRSGATEVIDLLVDASGTVLAGPTDVTSGHVPGGTNNPIALALGSGFGAVYSESDASATFVNASFWNGSGTPIASNVVLSGRGPRTRPGAVAAGSTFALAYKDFSNSLVFARFDSSGNPVIPEAVLDTGVSGRPLVGLAFSGEAYGLAYVAGQNLYFRLVAPDGAAIGSPVVVTTTQPDYPGPQVAWAGSGWALVWGQSGELYYAFLAPNGTVTVPLIQVTFTPDQPAQGWQLLWNGQHLGLTWYEYATPDPPGGDVYFTVLSLQGVKQFAPVAVGGGIYDDYNPAIYWDVDRFRIVLVGGDPHGLVEKAVLPDGTVVAGQRFYSPVGGQIGIAWNGATLGLCWPVDGYLRFTTTACLADATPPACPTASAVSDGSRTTVSWSAPSDPQSGIWRTSVYRDGQLLMQELPPSASYVDGGVVPGTPHAYEVRPRNWANLEPSSCTAVTPSANLSVTKSDGATSEVPGTGVTYTITVTNAGPSTVTAVTLTDTLPAALVGPIFTPSAGSYVAATGAWTGLSLAPTQSATLTLVATVASSATGSLVNTATVAPHGGLIIDPTPANDTATDSDSLVPSADLSVTKAGSSIVARGSQLAYTITVTNAGPSDAAGVVLSDPTPAGLTFVSNANGCTTAFPCSLGTIPAGQSRTVTSTFLVPTGYVEADPISNTATVTATTSDPVSANDQQTATTAVTWPAGSARFYTLTPCRVVDTRYADGPELVAGAARTFVVAGLCGVPSTAKAVSVNATVTDPTMGGYLLLFPTGTAPGAVSTVNYAVGQTRANNAIAVLGTGGAIDVLCGQPSGTTSFLLDVNGWFE